MMGCSTAYFLKTKDRSLNVSVVERDSTYCQCSTALSVGSIRMQFSNRENILISKFGAEFIEHIDEYVYDDDSSCFECYGLLVTNSKQQFRVWFFS